MMIFYINLLIFLEKKLKTRVKNSFNPSRDQLKEGVREKMETNRILSTVQHEKSPVPKTV